MATGKEGKKEPQNNEQEISNTEGLKKQSTVRGMNTRKLYSFAIKINCY